MVFRFLLIVFAFAPVLAFGQGSQKKRDVKPVVPEHQSVMVAGGLSTFWITGSNPATSRIVPIDPENVIFGGGFIGPQPGIAIKTTVLHDASRTLRSTYGIGYYFLGGSQRIQSSGFFVQFNHRIKLATASAGVEYALWRIPLANARFYGGADLLAVYSNGGVNEQKIDYINPNFTDDVSSIGKSSAFRGGASIKFGVDGEVFEPWFVNVWCSLGYLNLIGRDNARGEFLTPLNLLDSQESLVQMSQLNLCVQYRL